jgi:hypothetical protein
MDGNTHKQQKITNKIMSQLVAWVNRMPGSTPTLHVRGGKLIAAPTPCHKAVGSHTPDDVAEPAVYQIKVNLVPLPDPCPDVVTDVPFEQYLEHNYQGHHLDVKITYPDGSTDTAIIKTAW